MERDIQKILLTGEQLKERIRELGEILTSEQAQTEAGNSKIPLSSCP